MLKSGPAAVLLRDPELRTIALEVLAERGYRATPVNRDGVVAAIRAGNLAVLEFGPGGIEHAELRTLRAMGLFGLSRPILAAVDPDDSLACGAALAAGATSLVPTPFDRGGLAVHLTTAERWAAECARFGLLLEQLPHRILVFDRSGRLVFVNRSQPAGP